MKCNKCGEDTFLPFRCQYCGCYFCSEHRLPENHQCPQIEQARLLKREEQQATHEYSLVHPSLGKVKREFHFSRKEIMHLTVAALLVIGVGLTLPYIGYSDYALLAVLSIMFAVSFLMHEIAHKIMAQRYGLWAEFRLTLMGALLTLLSVVSPFKIIGPGAVMVRGSADRKILGKTSIVGPLANVILATVLCMIMFVPSSSMMFLVVAFYNASIAVFNLIPIGILDGYKVFVWNKKIWALAFAASLVLTVVSYWLLW